MKPGFVHLHLHTEYSLTDGIVRVKSLPQAVAKVGGSAVAITDQGNLFAMVKFYRAAIAAGVKPIIGADVWISGDDKQASRLVLLCQNQTGYRNLTVLISRSYLEGQNTGVPIIKKSWLAQASSGLIALSGGCQGDIGLALLSKHKDLAEELLQEWLQFFPDRFYLELQRTEREHEGEYIEQAVKLAERFDVPVVATNDVRFLEQQDFEAHEARVCIYQGHVLADPRRPRQYSEQQFLRTPEQMVELFSDIPEALENTIEIAKRCNLELIFEQMHLPNFPVPEGMTINDFFAQEAKKGLQKRLAHLLIDQDTESAAQKKLYADRLDLELDVIKRMEFPGYFLIVADFIRWAKSQQIPVGPGRGSGAGSLVAYALEITDLDPIVHDLLFERFLNPERVSLPDFDIDFCMEGRDRVIEYVEQKYGRDSVSQIITYGSMAARAVLRDVGRVLGHPYGFVDTLAKLIPFEIGMTLKKALKQEEQLLQRYREEEEVTLLIDLALKLEGVPRNAGKHAGGVVIAPTKLTEFTPLYCEAGGDSVVTQFDKDDVEAIGLVKFDFLGLRTLTIIDRAVRIINPKREKNNEPVLDIILLPLDDTKTFELLKACNTTAVFQLESRGMKDLIKRLQPDHFDEIVALVALFRPGPLQSGMVDDFINRKHGRAVVEYPHPKLIPILKPTYGVILYQEQVMQIAQVLAGYSLGKADLLRRAMGKKKAEEMAKQRAIFVDGATENHVDPHVANMIFDLMEKFAGYGFNKSHSAAYALISYQTAWLKAHYPAEFMAAVLSSDMDNTDKVVHFIHDCKKLNINIIAPDINHSAYQFTVNQQGEIIYGLGAIKGVGEAAAEIFIAERKAVGSFKDLFEFCLRIDTRKVNRKVLEALIKAGAMDSFNVHRASLLASIDAALTLADQQSRAQEQGQQDLFGNIHHHDAEQNSKQKIHYIQVRPWTSEEQLRGEKETLGIYLSGHPIKKYIEELKRLVTASIVDLKPSRDQQVVIAGFVAAMRVMNTKSGNRMAFVTLDDDTGQIDLAVFSDVFSQHRELLVKDQLLIVEGEVSVDDYSGGYKMSARKIYGIDQARASFAKSLLLVLDTQQMSGNFVTELQQTLSMYRGGKCPICIDYQKDNARAQLLLGKQWQVQLRQQLVDYLQEMKGVEKVLVNY